MKNQYSFCWENCLDSDPNAEGLFRDLAKNENPLIITSLKPDTEEAKEIDKFLNLYFAPSFSIDRVVYTDSVLNWVLGPDSESILHFDCNPETVDKINSGNYTRAVLFV